MLSRLAKDSVATVGPDCTLSEAAREMAMLSVGALVIVEAADGKPVGIVTDRDVVRALGEGLDPKTATVGQAAGAPLQTIGPDTPRDEVLARMQRHGIRRLPVVDERGRLTGIVALDDVLLELGTELGRIVELLQREFARERPGSSAHERSL